TATYEHAAEIDSLVFSPNGKQLAANASLWEVVQFQDRATLRFSSQKTKGHVVLFGEAGQIWAADYQQKDQPIRVWQLAPKELHITLPKPGRVIRPCLAFSPDGRLLLTARHHEEKGRSFERLDIWDLVEQKQLATWRQLVPWGRNVDNSEMESQN